MLLQVSFNLSLSWVEMRATYLNLKIDSSLNILDISRKQLWSPSVAFINTENAAGSQMDRQTSSFVLRQEESLTKDWILPEEVYLYKGSENPIVSYRKYRSEFFCDFNLIRYPFDSQLCFLEFRLRYRTNESFHFFEATSRAFYKGSSFLTEYAIGKVFMQPVVLDGYSGIKV